MTQKSQRSVMTCSSDAIDNFQMGITHAPHATTIMMTTLSIVVIPANEALPLSSSLLNIQKGSNVKELLEQKASSLLGDSTKLAPLLLPSSDSAGLYVYSIVPPSPLVKECTSYSSSNGLWKLRYEISRRRNVVSLQRRSRRIPRFSRRRH